MIAARQDVVIAEQILLSAVVFDQGAQGSAATVGDGIAKASFVIVSWI
jgi:hypothetical protein